MGFESLRGSQHHRPSPTEPAPLSGGRSFSRPALLASPEVPPPADLLPLRRLLAGLDPEGEPRALPVCGDPLDSASRLVALCGSFNPPHVAHLGLLRAGLEAAPGASGAFVLSARTVDKERVSGLLLEDRLWLLCRLAAGGPWPDVAGGMAALVTNRGLYVDQAAALQGLAPHAGRIVFVTGYDKIVQILDRRYYTDRDVALGRLFERAEFLVAARDGDTDESLAALLAEAENRRYAGNVRPLPLDPRLRHVSSTSVREAGAGAAGPGGPLPPVVERFLRRTAPFAEGEGGGYAARAAALAALHGA